ncbi:MAG: pseudouridine synthase, partial [Calditrichae bacterium]|nr:pseudouridine synthase [Calditrichia bacterium]NIW80898.1 pseudouridine synthase [Calditrichia bacterium]
MKKNHQSKPDKNRIRLNRYLAMAGIGSRRKCDDYIVKGRVKVNEQLTTRLGTRIDPEKDVVYFDGKRVELQKEFIYILLNKPLRTVSTAQDEKNRRTVLDILGTSKRLFPVGRLDYNSTGALLITNDGKLTYYLIHPRFRVKKIYRVLINKIMRPIDLHHFQHGIWLDGRKTHPCRVRELRRIDNRSYFEIELQEGRNRQIRRMFEVLGYHVEQLHRKRFANLSVDDLKPGEWRELSDAEVEE